MRARGVAHLALALALAGCEPTEDDVVLPPAPREGRMTLEAALHARRSVREFRAQTLTLGEIGQLAFAAQGESAPGRRTAPSAGALYPLELYVATADGLFHYEPSRHHLVRRNRADLRGAIQASALGQDALGQAPAVFILTGVAARTQRKYGDRAPRYVHMEAGHAAQNLLLQATALGLGSVPVGAFDDARLATVLSLPREEVPLYLLPVGHPR